MGFNDIIFVTSILYLTLKNESFINSNKAIASAFGENSRDNEQSKLQDVKYFPRIKILDENDFIIFMKKNL